VSHPFEQLTDRLPDLTTPIPSEVVDAARRTLFNVLATTIGAAPGPAVDVVVCECGRIAPGGTSIVPGRIERLHPLDAALATGVGAHFDDFDDTHLRTVIHPGAVELATLVGLQGELPERDASAILTAVAWGVEVQLRLGNAISPEHYDHGWHITGTCGPVGAATTAALLRGLDPRQTTVALALATRAAVGNREGFGSMTKPFHPGQAAVGGLRAADAAARGASWPGDTLAGPAGLTTRLAGGAFRVDELLGDLGTRWEILDNTFKPYPCGIVTHPAIEAAEALHDMLADSGGPGTVEEIVLICHPLVPELTGNTDPVDGLQARFSTAHGVAAGLLLGHVGLPAYADELVRSDDARRLRSLVRFEPTPDCARDAAVLRVRHGGRWTESAVEHARGSLRRPLTSAELLDKAHGLIEPILPGGADRLDALTRASGPGYLVDLLNAAVPPAAATPSPGSSRAEPTVPGADGDLARLVARRELRPSAAATARLSAAVVRARALPVTATDPRDAAAEIANSLEERPEVLAAAVAGAAVTTDDDDLAILAAAAGAGIALALADSLEVPERSVARIASAVSVASALGTSADVVLHTLGIAATQITGVAGDEEDDATRRRLLAEATADGVAAARLAHAGFTGPARPLRGRRGLISLLGPDGPSDDAFTLSAIEQVIDQALGVPSLAAGH
jgi:2-methylcitrate dehydratase PrpD